MILLISRLLNHHTPFPLYPFPLFSLSIANLFFYFLHLFSPVVYISSLAVVPPTRLTLPRRRQRFASHFRHQLISINQTCQRPRTLRPVNKMASATIHASLAQPNPQLLQQMLPRMVVFTTIAIPPCLRRVIRVLEIIDH